MLTKLKITILKTLIHSEGSIMACIKHALDKQLINHTQHQLITKSLSANITPIEQVRIDKAKTITLSQDMSIQEILEIYRSSTHSRYPVLDENGEVIGVILIKDLIPLLNEPSDIQLKSIIRPAHFAPETQPVLSLLNEMRNNHQHMSIVLDEYGQFQGIITIEDLLEQIVGDIEDEHDSHHPEYIRKLSSKLYRVSGLTPIEQFNQHFNTQLDITEFDTISGIVSKTLGHIPKQGETLRIEHLILTIHQSSSTTIQKITVKTDK